MTEIKWTMKSGKEAKVTVDVKAIEKKANDGWGNIIESGNYVVVSNLTAYVDGTRVVGESSTIESVPANDKGIVGKIGKLAMTEKNYNAVKSALDSEYEELNNDAGYQDYLRRVEESEKAEAEYQNHYNNITNAMNQ